MWLFKPEADLLQRAGASGGGEVHVEDERREVRGRQTRTARVGSRKTWWVKWNCSSYYSLVAYFNI